jgi:hypothetical protein
MTIYSTDSALGVQPFLTVSSTSNHPLGTVRRFQDSAAASGTQGGIEAIYLQGAASTLQGSCVTYNPLVGSTTLITTGAKNTGAPVAFAAAAINTTGSFGWYQIGGTALVAKGVVDFGLASPIYTSTVTAGLVTSAAGSGNQILGAITSNAASVSSTTGMIYVTLDRPHLQGAVTS